MHNPHPRDRSGQLYAANACQVVLRVRLETPLPRWGRGKGDGLSGRTLNGAVRSEPLRRPFTERGWDSGAGKLGGEESLRSFPGRYAGRRAFVDGAMSYFDNGSSTLERHSAAFSA